ncbi:MAG: hypothetical protein L6R37_003664 [Teloschistes peruensis]|nr:MAG: hypothetical protein L6R37_003664 [Teloschistes peruensis]
MDQEPETPPEAYMATLLSSPAQNATPSTTRIDSSGPLVLQHLLPPAPVTALKVLRDRSPLSPEEDERPAKKPQLLDLLGINRQTQHHACGVQTSPAATFSRGTQTDAHPESVLPAAVQEKIQALNRTITTLTTSLHTASTCERLLRDENATLQDTIATLEDENAELEAWLPMDEDDDGMGEGEGKGEDVDAAEAMSTEEEIWEV